MTADQLNRIKTWFDAYVKEFLAHADGMLRLHEVKRDHTYRVVSAAAMIARGLKWPDEEVRLAEATAWLHDAGRFSQIQEYKTLLDSRSVNHAARACAVISQYGVLEHLTENESQCIRASVLTHNQAVLPESLNEFERRFARLLRDADKLDILSVMQESVRNGSIRRNPEVALHLSLETDVNPELVRQIGQGQPGSYRLMHTVGDFFLVQMSWVYDINYAPTCRNLFENKTMENLIPLLPDTVAIRQLTRKLMDELARRAAE